MWLRIHLVRLLGGIAFCCQLVSGVASAESSQSKDFFIQTIHPLLQSKCYGCHGEDKKNIEGELDMSTREGLLKGGESGKPALIPGKPEDSPMFRAVLRREKMKMPPKERNKLAPEEIELLRKWIAEGAVWENASTTTNGQPKWNYKEEDIWAFKPARKIIAAQTEPRDAIDGFIQQKLREKNLQPAPLADKVTLIRRATYDLTGLPPTPKEIDEFANDKATNAFDKVIERLLASPRYGEQWARHWLDVVRYADTDGYSNDYERPNAWRYRDYVIRSFNSDKPYNRFVVEQIAGDECFSAEASNPAENEKLIAVGMLRMGPWEQTAMSVAAVTRQLFLDDVTAQIGATYLGLTTGCARCHDHKFDPIPTKDYYRLQSIFAPTEFETRNVDFGPGENVAGFESKIAAVKDATEKLRSRISEITGKHDRAVKKYLAERGYKNLRDVPLKERPKKDLGLTSTDQSIEKTLRKRIEYRERELQRYRAQALSVSGGRIGTNKTETARLHILVGGALESPGEVVTPGLLSAVYNSDDVKAPSDWNRIPEATEGRRLKLAQWIASPENPLTARVMVNRIWQYHFGKGIVKSSNNFGKMGDKPSHPELLDWLASYFIEHGCSVKEMHRLIMRSYSYQQGANANDAEATRKNDPEEKFVSHFLPRRLTAEELRDSMLSVSGELSEAMGGPPVYPEINLEAALQPRHIMGSVAPVYVPSPKRDERNRRTIYTVQIRSLINPMLQVFNSAPSEFSCERRDATTVTPQAFALFNSQNAYDAALAMAARLDKMSKSRATQIENAFRLAHGRKPDDAEKKICLKHLDELTTHHRQTKPVDFSFPAKVEREMVEELTGEPFQFEEDWDLSGYEYNLRPSEVTPEVRALADLCLTILNSNEFVYIY
ncbi:MAG: Planctomycete cytochrome [Verrucomicrobiales bacterium]|nr:Planctomycete cytochrome [Verrucomicrobiales bacterium]